MRRKNIEKIKIINREPYGSIHEEMFEYKNDSLII